jgi:hypothetical protein
VKVLRANREQAVKVLPETLHWYLNERVLPSSWYPARDHVELVRGLMAMMPLGPEPLIMMGRVAAQGDLQGIYRAMLFTGDVQRTLRQATALWRTYCDSGELVPTFDSERSATMVLSYYQDTSREMCGICGGYVLGLVMTAGGKDVKLRKLECRLDGAKVCRWQVTWI